MLIVFSARLDAMGEWVALRVKMVTPNPSLLRLNISHIASFR